MNTRLASFASGQPWAATGARGGTATARPTNSPLPSSGLAVLCHRGFTLIEIMAAIAILSLVVVAIYSSWTAILRSTKVGMEAAATAQRSRQAVRKLEESLRSAQLFTLNSAYYGFVAENGSEATLSFVARLPQSFPRSGRFGDFDVRRLTFTIERSQDGTKELVLRQQPILMDLDEDEENFPLVLARNVKEFEMGFWDSRVNDWVEEWQQTNQLPQRVLINLSLELTDSHSAKTVQQVPLVVEIAGWRGVPPNFQFPVGGPGPGGFPPPGVGLPGVNPNPGIPNPGTP